MHVLSRLSRSVVILLALALVIAASNFPVRGANKKSPKETQQQVCKYVTIPIFYLTDRELKGETYGPHRRYPSHCQHHMYYGTAFVNVANTGKENPGELWTSLGWKPSKERPSKVSSKSRIDPADPEACKKEFFQNLQKALDQSGKPDLCVFVHGAADGFEDCLLDAAGVAYAMKKPLVLYSWPSDPKRRRYFLDGSNCEWSQAHFNMFCKDLEALQQEHPLNVISISHSMGNRLVIRALPVVYGKHLVTDWELVSPDIDADTCRHYIMGYKQGQSKIRLYVSNRDKMLPLSQLLAGGYYRLGEAANPVRKLVVPEGSVLERIDFTALDTGFIGHSIPFDLIASMVNTDKPGQGLDIVPETSVKASRFEKWAGRSEKLAAESEESDLCKRIVRVK